MTAPRTAGELWLRERALRPRGSQRAAPEGYFLVACEGPCAFWLCRDVPERERRDEYNWLRTCEACGKRQCRDCLKDGETRCESCKAAA